jgi:outer membrane receptor protein involved in Fe transport
VLPWRFDLTVTGRWLERTGGGLDFREYALLDARLRWGSGPWTVTVDGLNLTDRRYEEIPGAVMPGRTALLGVTRAF